MLKELQRQTMTTVSFVWINSAIDPMICISVIVQPMNTIGYARNALQILRKCLMDGKGSAGDE